MTKKILAILLALTMTISFCACGGSGSDNAMTEDEAVASEKAELEAEQEVEDAVVTVAEDLEALVAEASDKGVYYHRDIVELILYEYIDDTEKVKNILEQIEKNQGKVYSEKDIIEKIQDRMENKAKQ